VALPLELTVRQVDAVEREDHPDHRVSRPGQQVVGRQAVTAADQRLASRPAAQRFPGKCLLDQSRDQRVRKGIGPYPPGCHRLRAEERAAALESGQAHVPDGIGVRPQDYVVEELLGRTDEEVAHGDVKLADPVVLAPLLIVVVIVPQGYQLAAE
jgi:hypothetical protein